MTLEDLGPDFDPNCPFCQIAVGSASSFIVKRWPRFLAFSPRRPATIGHTLVVPIAHVPTIWDLSTDLAQELIVRAASLAEVMRANLGLAGLNLIQSNGEAATQSIPHLHLHLVPRYKTDDMERIWPEGEPITDEQSEAAVAKLRAAMAARAEGH